MDEVFDLLYKFVSRKTNTFKGKKYEKTFYYAEGVRCMLDNKVSRFFLDS